MHEVFYSNLCLEEMTEVSLESFQKQFMQAIVETLQQCVLEASEVSYFNFLFFWSKYIRNLFCILYLNKNNLIVQKYEYNAEKKEVTPRPPAQQPETTPELSDFEFTPKDPTNKYNNNIEINNNHNNNNVPSMCHVYGLQFLQKKIYIYIYLHTHTHTHTNRDRSSG